LGSWATHTSNASSAATVASPLPADAAFHDLTVTIPTALAGDALVGVFNAPLGTVIFACTIPAGQTSCTNTTTNEAPAGTEIMFATTNTTVTSASFSYRLATPGVTIAAAKNNPQRSIFGH
jgi:hypothetical protein